MQDISLQNFESDLITASMQQPVLLDIWAPWCGPCKTLGPLIEKQVKAAKGAVELVKVNIDENQMLAQQLRIQSIPAVYAFFQGRPVDGFVGALPESQIKQFIDRLVQASGGPPGAEELAAALEEAKTALAAGGIAQAAEIYAAILEQEPETAPAIAGLVKVRLATDDVEGAKELLASLSPELAKHADIVAAKSAIDLAEQAADAGPVGELEAQVVADGKNHQARYDLAMALYAAGRREEALDHLLTSIKLDRKWNEEAARKQLLKFFEALGFADPLSVEGRKRLSSILFS